MIWSRAKTAAAAVALATAFPLLPNVAAPAAAEEVVCRTREHTTPKFPGGYSSITIELRLCVGRWHGNERSAWIDAYGWRANDGTMPPNGRFFHIVFKVRLERNDDVKYVKRCEFTRKANNHLALPDSEYPDELRCLPSIPYISDETGGWSADATLRYDIKYDEQGVKTKQFAGTPTIR
jgi:hypothetical protein